MPALTGSLLVACGLAFVLASGRFMPWQLATYAFMHAGLVHLAFNMYGLWMFGGELESIWGARRLAIFPGASVLAAAVAQLAVSALVDNAAPTVGASGGLFGLLVGFAMLFPQRRIMLLFPPIPMPARVFVTLYGAIELTLGRYWRDQAPFGRRRR
jgi:membrane associated rhomboid family serine protease